LSAFDDADRLLAAAEAAAKGNAGPVMVRVAYLMAIHQFEAAHALLDPQGGSAAGKPKKSGAVLGYLGDVAFQRGQYAEALAHWTQASELGRSPGTLSRLAEYHHQTGRSDEAKRLLAEADERAIKAQPMIRAMIRVRQGLIALDQGKPAEALAHYRRAADIFSGWFLIREHIAEALAELGETKEALAIYRAVLKENPDPAFMSAVADLHAAQGAEAEARAWRTKTAQAYDARMKRYPHAMTGHALDYYLEKGDAAKALELARKNHQARPGGEAKVKLAGALVLNAEIAEARSVIEAALASPFDTAPLHATASVIYGKSGDATKAKKHAVRANALAVGGMDGVAWLTASP